MDQNQNTENQNAETAAATAPAPKQEIIRGRMPVAVVALARFGSPKDLATKAAADALGTTVGKVDDIRKNRNFAYVTADFKPTEQQKADGIAWLERHPTGAQALIDELKAVPVATAEEAQAFEATRAANRGQSATTKEGEPAQAGGGNRRGGKKGGNKAEGNGQAQATGDALLS